MLDAATLLLALTAAAPAFAAATLPAEIPDSVKQSSDLGDSQRQEIDSDFNTVAAVLNGASDVADQSAAREWVDKAAAENTASPSSPAYLQALAHSANKSLLSVVKNQNADFRGKLEAGLAAAAVAKSAQGTELIPLASALLNDSSAPIVFTGMKVAAAEVPAILSQASMPPDQSQLLAQMLTAVQKHPESPIGGSIFELAASAFSEPVLGPQSNGNIRKAVVPLIFQLETSRLPAYQGDSAPGNPYADCRGIFALLSRDVWTGLSPKDQSTAMGLTAKFIEATAKWAAVPNDPGKFDSTPFIEALKSYGGELKLFANPNNGVVSDPDVDQAGTRLHSLFQGVGPAAIDKASGDAVQAIAKFVQTR